MIQIKDIFAKDINRDIRGVIKIGQDSDDIKQQELEEYVVTDELKRNFTRFFDAYDKSINNPTDEMGAWISGFFGSGKSHFLKILSYLLENDTVKGRQAIDYFLQDGKFDDDHLADAINKATSVPTEVALFNIDSKADSNAANNDNSILDVFLKVFNEQLGYSPIAVVADMERWLDSVGKYEAFKQAFADLATTDHSSWVELRKNYALMSTKIKTALVNCGALDETDANNYVQTLLTKKFSIDATAFAKLVKDYLDKKGNDAHFVFLADEVGQFIGDNNSRMLNLQTIVEQLGVQCQGRAWVVVTSQQQMDEVASNFSKYERDFSKIQGRFNTLINMSSANADEVIRKRLLTKKPLVSDQLADIYSQEQYSINNKINFSDAIKRQKFDNAQEFVENYPFIPYQFSLLKEVLTAVRQHGANGSHMSDGERSMLGTFQEATKRYENDELGRLVPFSAFFIGMKEFLSHDHQVVFDRAQTDRYVNKNNEDYCFNIQVLAVLFMVRYVDNYPSTLENIVTLLLDSVDQDRQALTAAVKDALNVLMRQNYIQKKLDTYQFLTDSEREVNEAINAIEVDDRKVAQKIGSYLLTSNLIDAKYTYPHMKNQYIFEFNEYIDEMGLNRLSNNLNIQIISPLIADNYREIDFKQKAMDGKNIIIVLKDDDRYIENYRHIEKISAYLQKPESRSDDKKQEIAFNRKAESKQVEEATQKMIKDDLIDADIYVLDDVLPKGSNFESRLEQAKKEIIDSNYRNLHYLTAVKTDQDILDTLKGKNKNDLFSDDEQAIKEIINYINVQASSMNNVSLANVIKRFGEIPYGYKPTDIAWMVAKAFVNGKVKFYFNNEQISLTSAQEDPKGTQRYLIGRNNITKLTIKPVKEISMRQKRDAKDFVEDILNKRLSVDENTTSEQMADDIINKTKGFIACLNALMRKKYNFDTPYPGHKLLAEGVNDLKAIVNVKDSDRVFQIISDHLDDYEDWHEELEDKAILEFYGDVEQTSNQQTIWNKAHRYLDRYNYAKSMISDQDLIGIAQKIKGCLNDDNFNITIPKLKELNTQFADKYNDVIQEAYDKIEAQIQISLDVIKKRIAESDFPEDKDRELNDMAENVFNTLLQKAKEYSNSASEDAYVSLVGLKTNIDGQTNEQKENIARVSSELAEQARREQELREKKTAAEENETSNEDASVSSAPVPNKPKPIVRVKSNKSKDITELVHEDSWKITNEEDLDKYLDELRKNIKQELQHTDILNVDFK